MGSNCYDDFREDYPRSLGDRIGDRYMSHAGSIGEEVADYSMHSDRESSPRPNKARLLATDAVEPSRIKVTIIEDYGVVDSELPLAKDYKIRYGGKVYTSLCGKKMSNGRFMTFIKGEEDISKEIEFID